ncbi:S9 family peptidase [soil metagenome]
MTNETRNSPADDPRPNPFTVDDMLALPRLSSLALSPGGERLVVSAAREADGGKKLATAIYELDKDGEKPPRRLTRSRPGESGAKFAPDGGLIFTSKRPNPDGEKADEEDEKPSLWLLPNEGGEARPLIAPSGGVASFAVAREAGAIVFSAGMAPGAESGEDDAKFEKAREDAGVSAQLFEGYPIRFWDHFLGPREPRLHFVAETPEGEGIMDGAKDLTPEPGRSLDLSSFDISPDGATVVSSRWNDTEAPTKRRLILIAIDTETGKERILADDPDAWYSSPAISPDGKLAAAIREEKSTPEGPGDHTLVLFDLESGKGGGEAGGGEAGGGGRDLLPGFDMWPSGAVWGDSKTLFFTADAEGHSPAFRLDVVESGNVVRLSGEGAYSDLCPAPDGETVFALRSKVSEPPRPVALDARAERRSPRLIPTFEGTPDLPAKVERVVAEAGDGSSVPAWLLVPPGASKDEPAPLAVFIHGGPLNSWNSWHWRWNPHVFVNEGWAVLLPDPALSTGYGMDAIRRGWGRWGDVVYGDVMDAVYGAEGREEIDGSRAVVMGGSFGGYMANWVIGKTDRFRAAITQASLWNLENFHGTTDLGAWWEREFGDPYKDLTRYRKQSPHSNVAGIKTPTLVIHGEMDFRVPISEALTLWTDLKRHGVPAKFLYFPDENHWVVKPNNSRLWYETVLGFMEHHARGGAWEKPELL